MSNKCFGPKKQTNKGVSTVYIYLQHPFQGFIVIGIYSFNIMVRDLNSQDMLVKRASEMDVK